MTNWNDQARAFDEKNPAVWQLFKHFAQQACQAGSKRFGAKMVWERIRWECRVSTTEEAPKLNNNHTAYYARKWNRAYPEKAVFHERGAA